MKKTARPSTAGDAAAPLAGIGRAAGSHIAAQALAPALHAQAFSMPPNLRGLVHVCVLLTEGAGELRAGELGMALAAPVMAWVPAERECHLRIGAGARGRVVWVTDVIAKGALGNHAESAQLRRLLDRPVVAGEIESAEALAEVERAFAAIEHETRRSASGSWVYLSAQIALLLVHCWRSSGLEEMAAKGYGTDSTLLFRFRQLVELNFREHWGIARYARALGITHDRLHDVCVRTLNKTPLQLVHERVTHEAGQRIARSGFTIEQIAGDLGFRSTAYFTRFFKRNAGTSPGRYRRAAIGAQAARHDLGAGGFADWP